MHEFKRCCRRLATSLLLLCALTSCQTVTPDNRMLDHLMALPAPEPARSLAGNEMAQEKTAMVQSLEQYLEGKYSVVDRRFILSREGFSEGALLESQASQYLEKKRGVLQRPEWKEMDIDLVGLWKLGEDSSRYIAIAKSDEPLPDREDRRLIGYFVLVPNASR